MPDATVGACIDTITAAVARFKRADTSDVLGAYQTIAERADICAYAGRVEPDAHASLIYTLCRGQGMRIVPRSDVCRIRNALELGEAVELKGGGMLHHVEETFDPRASAILMVEPSVVSYMDGNPDYILGTNATVVAPTFKSALIWWACE